jgi:hypothetical protein
VWRSHLSWALHSGLAAASQLFHAIVKPDLGGTMTIRAGLDTRGACRNDPLHVSAI